MRVITILLLVCVLFACKETPLEKPADVTDILAVVVNEGNFNTGNASLGLLKQDFSYNGNVFESANGRKPGDVLQDFVYANGFYYLVSNNTGTVEKIDKKTFKSVAYSDKFNSPRKFAWFNDTTAFITELYSNLVYEINPVDLQIRKTIPCSGWTEAITVSGNNVLIVNVERQKLLVLNPLSGTFSDSVALDALPGDMVVDAQQNIWIYCGGETNAPASLLKIDGMTYNVSTKVVLPVLKEFFPRMCINDSKDTLFLLQNGISKIAVSNPQKTEMLAGPSATGQYYGLGYIAKSKLLVVSEMKNFATSSYLSVLKSDGTVLKSGIKAGALSSLFSE